MKYQCEICGAVLLDMEKCAEHEKECRLHNQTALWLVEELGALMKAATIQKIGLGVEITTPNAENKPKTDFCTLNGVEFIAKKNRVILYVKQPETRTEANADKDVKPVKKS